MAEFSPGDRVRLKSGGPDMTVDSVKRPSRFAELDPESDETPAPEVWCVWFKGSERMRESFTVATLESAD